MVSPILLYYLCSWTISTVPCVIHYGYMLLFWRADGQFQNSQSRLRHSFHDKLSDVIYDSYVLFWTAVFAFASVCLLPTSLLFLTLDRCWILISGSKIVKYQKLLLMIDAIISIGCFALIFYGYGKDPPVSSSTNCSTSGCIVSQSGHHIYVTFKMIAGGTNVICGIIFFVLLNIKRKSVTRGSFLQTHEQKKRKAVSQFILKLIPDSVKFRTTCQ